VRGAEKALKSAQVAWTLAQQALAMKDVNEVQPYAKVIAVFIKRAIDALE